jgi:hypothetical protein
VKILKYISISFFALATISVAAQTSDSTKEKMTQSSEMANDESVNMKKDDAAKKSNWSVSADVTLTSRFIWRGLVLGDYPSIQPNVTFSNGGFFTGVWASYSLSRSESGGSASTQVPVSDNYKEIIPYVGYGFKLAENSNLSLIVLTHYNPNVGEFFNFDNRLTSDDPALTNRVEFRAIYNIGKFDAFLGWDFLNDPSSNDNTSLYLEFGYTVDMPKEIKVRPFVSFVPKDNYYTTDGKADVTQVGFYTSKSYNIGKELGLTLKLDAVYNPDRDQFNSAINATIKL